MFNNLHKTSWPREKLIAKGAQALNNAELLAILLRVGYKNQDVLKIANKLMTKFTLSQFAKLGYSELIEIKGIGKAQACLLLASQELIQRVLKQTSDLVIESPKDILQIVDSVRRKQKEYLIGLYLNARNNLLKKEIISIGTLTTSLIHPREVFAPAIKNKAAQLIIVHNHPSGEVTPSKADLEITKSLVQAGKLLDIHLLDHLIVSKKGYYSFREHNLIINN